jgi:hypothetical protein
MKFLALWRRNKRNRESLWIGRLGKSTQDVVASVVADK